MKLPKFLNGVRIPFTTNAGPSKASSKAEKGKHLRALVSFDLIVSDLNALEADIAEAKTSGDNIRLAKVTPNGNGKYTANVDLLIGRGLAATLIGDYFANGGARVNSARSYKGTAKTFNLPKNAVTFKPAAVVAVNPSK
jgi:hypothetical protein